MIDTTTIPAAIKRRYSPSTIQEQTQKEHQFLSMVKKRTDLVGQPFRSFLLYGSTVGGSANYTNAQTNAGAPANSYFDLPPTKLYSLPLIDNLTMELTGNDMGAFMSALKLGFEGAMTEVGRALSIQCWGDGTGTRGIVGVVTGTTQITLNDQNANVNFDNGEILVFAQNLNGYTALRASGQTATITSIVRETGILNFSGGLPSGVGVGDLIGRQGDLPNGLFLNNGSGTTAGSVFCGVGGFCPQARPAGTDSFGGTNRSLDTWRLGGGFVNGAGQNAIDRVHLAVTFARQQNAKPDFYWCNEIEYDEIQRSIQGKTEYETVEAFDMPQIAFESIVIRSGGRKIRVMCDNSIPSNAAFLLQMDTWTLWSAGGAAARVLNYQNYGAGYIPYYNADALQIRLGGYPLLECTAPGRNVRVQTR